MGKSNFRIEGNIENESCSTTWVDTKLSQNQITELEETKKMKVVQLHN